MTKTTISGREIDNAAENAVKVISEAAKAASNTLAEAALSATKLLASNASDAAKITSQKDNNDHDLLVELRTKLEGIKVDIQELKSGTTLTINDHENRIKYLENATTKLMAYGTALIFAVGIVQFLLSKLWG